MMNNAKIRIVPKDGILIFNQGYSLTHTISTLHDDYVSTLSATTQILSNEAGIAIAGGVRPKEVPLGYAVIRATPLVLSLLISRTWLV